MVNPTLKSAGAGLESVATSVPGRKLDPSGTDVSSKKSMGAGKTVVIACCSLSATAVSGSALVTDAWMFCGNPGGRRADLEPLRGLSHENCRAAPQDAE